MEFIIHNFHLTPYVRMTRAGKWYSPTAQRYIDNQGVLSWEYKRIMQENGWSILPAKQPLYIKWMISRTGSPYKADFDNMIKALCDSANGIVFCDDRFITLDLGGEKRQGENLVIVSFGLVEDLQIHEK